MRNRIARRVTSFRIALTHPRAICYRRSAFRKKRVITESKTSVPCLGLDEQAADARICAGSTISFWSISPCSRDEIFWQRRLSEPQ
ncbi:hypothetical protein [Bradyrhizobium neotropicale]|uniref:hypothetical protein n=1 Tax=Bradyrhizobium neotropicale TaxID=1497615 RepID=UPI001AD6F53D|nr:hypothetical protein [Bradyrhizobium neotropicale]